MSGTQSNSPGPENKEDSTGAPQLNSGFLQPLEHKTSESQQLLQSIRATYLDTSYKTGLGFVGMHSVNSPGLARRFEQKRRVLSELAPNKTSEIFAFACYKSNVSVEKIVNQGLTIRPGNFNFLGDSQYGVNLCKHADVQLKSAEASSANSTNIDYCWLLVFRVMPGRAQYVTADMSSKIPTIGCDCHISDVQPRLEDELGQQAKHSQIFLYEYSAGGSFSRSPSQILPHAVVTFSNNKQGRPSNRSIPQSIPKAVLEQRYNAGMRAAQQIAYGQQSENAAGSGAGGTANVNPGTRQNPGLAAAAAQNLSSLQQQQPQAPGLYPGTMNPMINQMAPGMFNATPGNANMLAGTNEQINFLARQITMQHQQQQAQQQVQQQNRFQAPHLANQPYASIYGGHTGFNSNMSTNRNQYQNLDTLSAHQAAKNAQNMARRQATAQAASEQYAHLRTAIDRPPQNQGSAFNPAMFSALNLANNTIHSRGSTSSAAASNTMPNVSNGGMTLPTIIVPNSYASASSKNTSKRTNSRSTNRTASATAASATPRTQYSAAANSYEQSLRQTLVGGQEYEPPRPQPTAPPGFTPGQVITIVPEGTAPHELPSYTGGFATVKREPVERHPVEESSCGDWVRDENGVIVIEPEDYHLPAAPSTVSSSSEANTSASILSASVHVSSPWNLSLSTVSEDGISTSPMPAHSQSSDTNMFSHSAPSSASAITIAPSALSSRSNDVTVTPAINITPLLSPTLSSDTICIAPLTSPTQPVSSSATPTTSSFIAPTTTSAQSNSVDRFSDYVSTVLSNISSNNDVATTTSASSVVTVTPTTCVVSTISHSTTTVTTSAVSSHNIQTTASMQSIADNQPSALSHSRSNSKSSSKSKGGSGAILQKLTDKLSARAQQASISGSSNNEHPIKQNRTLSTANTLEDLLSDSDANELEGNTTPESLPSLISESGASTPSNIDRHKGDDLSETTGTNAVPVSTETSQRTEDPTKETVSSNTRVGSVVQETPERLDTSENVITDDSVINTEISDNSVMNTEISDNSVMNTEISDSSVINTEISDNSVINTDISKEQNSTHSINIAKESVSNHEAVPDILNEVVKSNPTSEHTDEVFTNQEQTTSENTKDKASTGTEQAAYNNNDALMLGESDNAVLTSDDAYNKTQVPAGQPIFVPQFSTRSSDSNALLIAESSVDTLHEQTNETPSPPQNKTPNDRTKTHSDDNSSVSDALQTITNAKPAEITTKSKTQRQVDSQAEDKEAQSTCIDCYPSNKMTNESETSQNDDEPAVTLCETSTELENNTSHLEITTRQMDTEITEDTSPVAQSLSGIHPGKKPTCEIVTGEVTAVEKATFEKAADKEATDEEIAVGKTAGEKAADKEATDEETAVGKTAGEKAAGKEAAGKEAAGEKAAGKEAAGEAAAAAAGEKSASMNKNIAESEGPSEVRKVLPKSKPSRKKKKTRKSQNKALKKILESNKVVVCEDGTIELVVESVHRQIKPKPARPEKEDKSCQTVASTEQDNSHEAPAVNWPKDIPAASVSTEKPSEMPKKNKTEINRKSMLQSSDQDKSKEGSSNTIRPGRSDAVRKLSHDIRERSRKFSPTLKGQPRKPSPTPTSLARKTSPSPSDSARKRSPVHVLKKQNTDKPMAQMIANAWSKMDKIKKKKNFAVKSTSKPAMQHVWRSSSSKKAISKLSTDTDSGISFGVLRGDMNIGTISEGTPGVKGDKQPVAEDKEVLLFEDDLLMDNGTNVNKENLNESRCSDIGIIARSVSTADKELTLVLRDIGYKLKDGKYFTSECQPIDKEQVKPKRKIKPIIEDESDTSAYEIDKDTSADNLANQKSKHQNQTRSKQDKTTKPRKKPKTPAIVSDDSDSDEVVLLNIELASEEREKIDDGKKNVDKQLEAAVSDKGLSPSKVNSKRSSTESEEGEIKDPKVDESSQAKGLDPESLNSLLTTVRKEDTKKDLKASKSFGRKEKSTRWDNEKSRSIDSGKVANTGTSDPSQEVLEVLKRSVQRNSAATSSSSSRDRSESKPRSSTHRERQKRSSRSRSPDRVPSRRRSRSRSPLAYRSSNRNKRSRSRSRSPKRSYRSGYESRRRYSRSPSPRRNRYRSSRSPRRRYRSRSNSPRRYRYRSRSTSPSSRDQRKRSAHSRSRSPGPSSKQNYRSASRSPTKELKSADESPAKQAEDKEKSGKDKTEASKGISTSEKSLEILHRLREKGNTAVDDLFDIVYGKNRKNWKKKSNESGQLDLFEIMFPKKNKAGKEGESPPKSKKLSLADYKNRHKSGSSSTDLPKQQISPSHSASSASLAPEGTETPAKKAALVDYEDDDSDDEKDIDKIEETYVALKEAVKNLVQAGEISVELEVEVNRIGDELVRLKAKQSGIETEPIRPNDPLNLNKTLMKSSSASSMVSPPVPTVSDTHKRHPNPSALLGQKDPSPQATQPAWKWSTLSPNKDDSLFNAYGDQQSKATAEKPDSERWLEQMKDINSGKSVVPQGVPPPPLPKRPPPMVPPPPSNTPPPFPPQPGQPANRTYQVPPPKKMFGAGSLPAELSIPSSVPQYGPNLPPAAAAYQRTHSEPHRQESTEQTQPAYFSSIQSGKYVPRPPPSNVPTQITSRDPRLKRRESNENAAMLKSPPLPGDRQVHGEGFQQPPLQPQGSGMMSPGHYGAANMGPPPFGHPQHPYGAQPPPAFPGIQYPPLPNEPPLKRIRIDVPEINYEGVTGSPEDPRLLPRDRVPWNNIPTRVTRLIPWENSADVAMKEQQTRTRQTQIPGEDHDKPSASTQPTMPGFYKPLRSSLDIAAEVPIDDTLTVKISSTSDETTRSVSYNVPNESTSRDGNQVTGSDQDASIQIRQVSTTSDDSGHRDNDDKNVPTKDDNSDMSCDEISDTEIDIILSPTVSEDKPFMSISSSSSQASKSTYVPPKHSSSKHSTSLRTNFDANLHESRPQSFSIETARLKPSNAEISHPKPLLETSPKAAKSLDTSYKPKPTSLTSQTTTSKPKVIRSAPPMKTPTVLPSRKGSATSFEDALCAPEKVIHTVEKSKSVSKSSSSLKPNKETKSVTSDKTKIYDSKTFAAKSDAKNTDNKNKPQILRRSSKESDDNAGIKASKYLKPEETSSKPSSADGTDANETQKKVPKLNSLEDNVQISETLQQNNEEKPLRRSPRKAASKLVLNSEKTLPQNEENSREAGEIRDDDVSSGKSQSENVTSTSRFTTIATTTFTTQNTEPVFTKDVDMRQMVFTSPNVTETIATGANDNAAMDAISQTSLTRPSVTAVANQWSQMLQLDKGTANLDSRISLPSNVKGADSEVLDLMQRVGNLKNYDKRRLAKVFDKTLGLIVTQKKYYNPTADISVERRTKLIQEPQCSINESVLEELKIEERLDKLEQKVKALKDQMQDLSNAVKQPQCPPNLQENLTLTKEQLHLLQLAREYEIKKFEKYSRYQKIKELELLPEEFHLDEEKFISKEGCLMFLFTPMSAVDSRHLCAYKREIERLRLELKSPSMNDKQVLERRDELGWMHKQRKEVIINICITNHSAQQIILQRMRDKLQWYRLVQCELESKGTTGIKREMLNYTLERIAMVEEYIGVLASVKLNDALSVWMLPKDQSPMTSNEEERKDNIAPISSSHKPQISAKMIQGFHSADVDERVPFQTTGLSIKPVVEPENSSANSNTDDNEKSRRSKRSRSRDSSGSNSRTRSRHSGSPLYNRRSRSISPRRKTFRRRSPSPRRGSRRYSPPRNRRGSSSRTYYDKSRRHSRSPGRRFSRSPDRRRRSRSFSPRNRGSPSSGGRRSISPEGRSRRGGYRGRGRGSRRSRSPDFMSRSSSSTRGSPRHERVRFSRSPDRFNRGTPERFQNFSPVRDGKAQQQGSSYVSPPDDTASAPPGGSNESYRSPEESFEGQGITMNRGRGRGRGRGGRGRGGRGRGRWRGGWNNWEANHGGAHYSNQISEAGNSEFYDAHVYTAQLQQQYVIHGPDNQDDGASAYYHGNQGSRAGHHYL